MRRVGERFSGGLALIIRARPFAEFSPVSVAQGLILSQGAKKRSYWGAKDEGYLQGRQGPAFSFPKDFQFADCILMKYPGTKARAIPMANQSKRLERKTPGKHVQLTLSARKREWLT